MVKNLLCQEQQIINHFEETFNIFNYLTVNIWRALTPKCELEEYEQLLKRVENRELRESDYETISCVFDLYFWLQNSLKEAKISIGRLTKLFKFTSPSQKED